MSDFFLPYDIICNIIARLPAKPLLRLRCVSRYWNHMLTEPNFMKLRSRKTIILTKVETLYLIDDNVPTYDTSNSIVMRCYPFENLLPEYVLPKVIGTFNGIVLFRRVYTLILYNPFTGVSKKLPFPPTFRGRCAYGFGYGANLDDLKVVRFREHSKICDVYNVKKSSWTSWNTSKYNISTKFEHSIGTFTNGFLYWIAYNRSVFIVLDVKNMVLSEKNLPFKRTLPWDLLGTINGCLCALHQVNATGFDMWVMKEHNQWSKIYSFKSPVKGTSGRLLSYALCILASGRILMVIRPSRNLIIYDPCKDVCNSLNILVSELDFSRMHVLEYVESLVSPLDLCSSRTKSNVRRMEIE